MDNIMEYIIAILSGLATAIPLIITLIKYIKKAIEEKNWNQLLKLVTDLMKEAELKFDNGLDRKSWVLAMVQASANTINYQVDMDAVSELVDSLCAMSKVVNGKIQEGKVDKAE